MSVIDTIKNPREINSDVYGSFFNSPDGSAVLEDLIVQVTFTSTEVNADNALFQMGRRSIVQYIIEHMQAGERKMKRGKDDT
jgi:hypothetical protein